jgi:hypothetical protein
VGGDDAGHERSELVVPGRSARLHLSTQTFERPIVVLGAPFAFGVGGRRGIGEPSVGRDRGLAERRREAEVDHANPPAGEHDVGGPERTVSQPGVVRGVEDALDLGRDALRGRGVERPAGRQPVGERPALEGAHHHELDVTLGRPLRGDDARDVRVLESRRRAQGRSKASLEPRVRHELAAEQPDRHGGAEAHVLRQPERAERILAELAIEVITPVATKAISPVDDPHGLVTLGGFDVERKA